MARIFSNAWVFGLFTLAAGAAEAANTLNGAEVYSNESVKFGRWEIRMQAAATPGSVSAFFTYYNNSYLGLPEPWREIDIEVIGKNADGFQSNLITGNAAAETTSEAFQTTAADLSKGFHTYELDWTPDSIVYRIDGQTVRKNPASDPQVQDLTGEAESYRMNLWASTAVSWAGALDSNALPVTQTINWIAYSAYTPGQGPNGSDFTPAWTDDFNTLDPQRWSLANYTFDGNLADFTPANAVVSGGYLMLILSKKGWTGTLTPPSDPQGNTHPVTLESRAGYLGSRIESFGRSLQVNNGDLAGEISVNDVNGRILARSNGTSDLRVNGLPHAVLFVRTPDAADLMTLP